MLCLVRTLLLPYSVYMHLQYMYNVATTLNTCFNVSNLMGMKDVGKTLLFSFFQKFENAHFSHLHSKSENSAIMTPKNLFREKYQYGYKKRRILC